MTLTSTTRTAFLREIESQGYAILPHVVPREMLGPLRAELGAAIEAEA